VAAHVVTRGLLAVGDIQENEIGCGDHMPFNSGSRRFHSMSFSDTVF
jgi:hypothetical protein